MYQFTEASTAPLGAAVRSMFAQGHSDETVDAVLAAMNRATSPVSMVQFRGMGGAISHIGNVETAFSHRDKRYFTTVLGLWMDPSEDPEPHREWAQSLWDEIKGETAGVYVNFLGDEGEARIRQAYPGEAG
jgi:hypothetical protein